MLDKIRISAIKFNEGGAAMLAAISKNHQRAIEGEENRAPLVNIMLRVFVDS